MYDVFARKKRGDALRHIGYVDAPGDALAQVYAWKTYDEETWFEMCVVPRSAILPVNRDDGPWGRRVHGAEFQQEKPEGADPRRTPGHDGSGTHGRATTASQTATTASRAATTASRAATTASRAATTRSKADQ